METCRETGQNPQLRHGVTIFLKTKKHLDLNFLSSKCILTVIDKISHNRKVGVRNHDQVWIDGVLDGITIHSGWYYLKCRKFLHLSLISANFTKLNICKKYFSIC